MMRMFNGKHDDPRVVNGEEGVVACLARGYYIFQLKTEFHSKFRHQFNREATHEEWEEVLINQIDPHRERGTWPDMPEEVWELAFKDWEKKTGKNRSELNFDP